MNADLSDTERQFLTFALNLAADQMASRGDEFTEEDDAALATFRRIAAEPNSADSADALNELFERLGPPAEQDQPAPQCPEALYTPETDTLRRCIQRGPHDWHETEHGTQWRDVMADQDLARLDSPWGPAATERPATP
ncbi:hypothetical protein [Streptomyces sp. NPDC005969]|uniref:hypothetical protein n=1 Tax=Streptomyces sp. NPDC005969 TaxID=3156722 RepID=UPI0033C1DE86